MGLDKKPLSKVENTGALRRLYHTAFPKEEQMPWWILRLTSLRRDMGVEGFYEGDRLRGFTHSVATEDVLFLLFFAVNDDCRGQGWGSEILTKLKAENPGRTVVLNVELLDPEAAQLDMFAAVQEYFELFYHCKITRDQFDDLMRNSLGA